MSVVLVVVLEFLGHTVIRVHGIISVVCSGVCLECKDVTFECCAAFEHIFCTVSWQLHAQTV